MATFRIVGVGTKFGMSVTTIVGYGAKNSAASIHPSTTTQPEHHVIRTIACQEA
jgi:hypothetical protein